MNDGSLLFLTHRDNSATHNSHSGQSPISGKVGHIHINSVTPLLPVWHTHMNSGYRSIIKHIRIYFDLRLNRI